MNCNCILILVGSRDRRKMFLLASFIFVIRACQGEKRKSPTWGKEPLNAAACGKTERKGEHKIARQNASSPASRVSLRYNCASRTRMAVAEDVRRRSRRRLCQTNRRTMRTLTFLRSDVTQTNQRKRRGREGGREGGTSRETGYRGDTSFVSEWIWVQSLLLKTSSFFMHRLLGWQQWTRNRVHHTVIGCSMDVVAGRNPESSPRPQVIGRLDLSEQLGTKYLNRRWKRGRRKMRSLHSGNLIS